MIAFRSTAPQPITATSSPGCTRALRIAAPAPVGTAHPIIAATSNGNVVVDVGHSIRG
jgi:hypothetical protein